MATDDFMTDDLEIGFGGGPPAGAYKAVFQGVKKTEHPEFGPGLRFEFRVADGPQAGAVAAVTTGAKPTPANKAGKVIAQLTGTSTLLPLAITPTPSADVHRNAVIAGMPINSELMNNSPPSE